ncbi:hypothetical protein PNOK_0592100 [Pyrrhoderma noxium]|uniref:Uncharacterized protein n=1 Tax=Pyrrhoderma noxium TaxID=2282107 RepID=A0A286UHL0_9AGAM|nr:hypothetical protein PNOK_0592100 [Pyrrhoderma noxium]
MTKRELFTVATVPTKLEQEAKQFTHSLTNIENAGASSSSDLNKQKGVYMLPQDSQSLPGPLVYSFHSHRNSEVSLLPQDSQPLSGSSSQLAINANQPITVYNDDSGASHSTKKAHNLRQSFSATVQSSPPPYSLLPPSSSSRSGPSTEADQSEMVSDDPTNEQPASTPDMSLKPDIESKDIEPPTGNDDKTKCCCSNCGLFNLFMMTYFCCCFSHPKSKSQMETEDQVVRVKKAHPSSAELE